MNVSWALILASQIQTWEWPTYHLGIIDCLKEVILFSIQFAEFSLMFLKQLLRTLFSVQENFLLQKSPKFQLSTPKVEGQKYIALGFQPLTLKVEVQ